jgi:hypothetical protein
MKNLKIMSKLLGGLLVLSILTVSCKNDNENEPSVAPTRLKVDYSATVSQQLLDVANVTVRYIGDNGQVASEQMSSTTWSKSVTIALPAKAGLSIQPTLKGPVAEGEYLISAKGQMTYGWLNGNGQLLKNGITEYTPVLEATFYAEGLGQYLGAITSTCQLSRAFAKDYGVTDTDIVWGGNASDDNTQNTGISDEGATDNNR